ncbi:hypothetical protein [Alteribacter aurantiacus]|uniref:hypothetical protein n=1 Tax=Alteribacter aurantiacus TaxID=254410 RepID=UPI0012EC8A19|nr:hypothetical protein [Alteribacter aurantiacus]
MKKLADFRRLIQILSSQEGDGMRKGRLTAQRKRSIVKGIYIKIALFSYIFFLVVAQTMGSTNALFNDTESISMQLKAADEFPDPFLDEWDKSSIEVTNGKLESCEKITAEIKNVGDGDMGGKLRYWIYFGSGPPGNNLEENEKYTLIFEGKYGPLNKDQSETITYEMDKSDGNGKYFVVAERHPKHANGKGNQNKGLPRTEIDVSCFEKYDENHDVKTHEEVEEQVDEEKGEEKNENLKEDSKKEEDEEHETSIDNDKQPEDQQNEEEPIEEEPIEEKAEEETIEKEIEENVSFKLDQSESEVEVELTNNSSVDMKDVVITLHTHQENGSVKNNNTKVDEVQISNIEASESKRVKFEAELLNRNFSIKTTSASGKEHWSEIYETKKN